MANKDNTISNLSLPALVPTLRQQAEALVFHIKPTLF